MGVQGLWSLVESAGKPVALESLENKVLAVGECINRDSVQGMLLKLALIFQTCPFG